MEYVVRGVCGEEGCRETRYYLENGLWFCRQGHQQEGRQVEADEDDFGIQGKTNRQKKVVSTERVSKNYQGRQAYRLFIQAYQLVLWKQCHALVQEKGLPAELEKIVQDLWALRLQKLQERIEDPSVSEENTPVFSSQPEDFSEREDEPMSRRKATDSPRLLEALGLCYLGALLLRIPITVGDMLSWVTKQEIPFIRAIREIPWSMKDRLPPSYHHSLDPKSVPKGEYLHQVIWDLVILYHHEFGISFPPINSPLMLFGHVRRLALPLEVFPAVNRLGKLVAYDYHFPHTHSRWYRPIHLPEVQLVSLLVVVTKLFYPFDDIKRYPASLKEPSTHLVRWNEWAVSQRMFEEREKDGGKLGRGNEIKVKENDVFQMTPQQLDEYMDWYEKSWIDSKGSNPFADIFSTGRANNETSIPETPSQDEGDEDEATTKKLRTVLGELKSRRTISDEDAAQVESAVSRPGNYFKKYRSKSELPETATPFYESAAKLAGISLSTLIKVVSQTEDKIQRWQKKDGGEQNSGTGSEEKGVLREEVLDEDVNMDD